jgi:hypothetical protein
LICGFDLSQACGSSAAPVREIDVGSIDLGGNVFAFDFALSARIDQASRYVDYFLREFHIRHGEHSTQDIRLR